MYQSPDKTKATRQKRPVLLLLAMSLGFAVVQLDVSVVNVAIKSIGVSFGGGISNLQWIVNAYTLAFASFILTAGALSDRLGAKRIFLLGFTLFTFASALCGLAPSIDFLIAARALQGIGAAILVPCSLALLNHTYTQPSERNHAVGLWAASASAALAAGPLIGGLLISLSNWRAIFFINVPLGVIGILFTWYFAHETDTTKDRGIDWAGQVLAVVTLVSLAIATITSGSKGWGNAWVIGGYIIALVGSISFIIVEKRRSAAMLPLDFFKQPIFSGMNAIGFIINVAFYGLIFVLSLFLQQSQHLSILRTGLAFAPMTIAVLLGNVYASRSVQLLGSKRTISIGLGLLALGGIALVHVQAATAYMGLLGQLVVIGLGLGLVVPVITSELLKSVAKSRSGVASGVLNTARQTGSVVGVSVFGSLVAGNHFTRGLHYSAVLLGILAIAALTCTMIIHFEGTHT